MAKTKGADPATCAHKTLTPTGTDVWECNECGDTIRLEGKKVTDSSGRDLRATHPAEELVMDGKTGRVKTASNGEKPAQPELLQLSNDDIIHSITLKQAEINVASSEAGRARKRVKDLKEQREKMINELIGRDDLKHNIELDFGDDEDDED